MIDNNELDINDKKDVTVVMDADFAFLLGKIQLCKNVTQRQALELLHKLDMYPTPQKSCPKVLGASYSSKVTNWIKWNEKHYRNELELYLEIGKCMKCQKKTSGMTQRDKEKLCAENIKSGKCRDTMVCNTVGAVLFPELYQKTK